MRAVLSLGRTWSQARPPRDYVNCTRVAALRGLLPSPVIRVHLLT
ncbi:hypothetical protein [Kutzneria chonburiensis]|uniref:Uncharacterized protein n=1 Tax=Kutzneria chonburiensis TaxID=1483604 RepID=A0ABV6MSX2_9PSEU|nr:hypothetical protein [Kutzneria chonburiensis]